MSVESRTSEVHPELFHYTSVEALENILKTQYLWATHWKYLNDGKELEHFAEILPDLIEPGRVALAKRIAARNKSSRKKMNALGGAEKIGRKEALGLTRAISKSIVNPDPNEQIFEYYVTSLSTTEGEHEAVRINGLLSQWRYYGKNGGYAIVLDTAELEELSHLEAKKWGGFISLGEVGYSHESIDVLRSRIDSVPKFLDLIDNCFFSSSKECESLLVPALQCFIHYKHWCFSEEREVRLVTVLNGPKLREIHRKENMEWKERKRHFEVGAPRIHLFDDLEFEGRAHRLPIKRIIVGPGPNQLDRERRLRGLLDVLGYSIQVVLSDMPIRF